MRINFPTSQSTSLLKSRNSDYPTTTTQLLKTDSKALVAGDIAVAPALVQAINLDRGNLDRSEVQQTERRKSTSRPLLSLVQSDKSVEKSSSEEVSSGQSDNISNNADILRKRRLAGTHVAQAAAILAELGEDEQMLSWVLEDCVQLLRGRFGSPVV